MSCRALIRLLISYEKGGHIDVKVAIVTGGGSVGGVGVGRAICLTLARNGYRVAVVDRDESPGRETADAIVAAGGQAAYVAADVTADADCAGVLKSVGAAFGRLDVLVNNVGIVGSGMAEEEQWDLLMEVNAKSAFLMAKNAVPAMPAGGAIVNISSYAALQPNNGPSAYPASKAALIGLTTSLAVRHGRRGIRVNCVCPGPIHTPMAMRAILGADPDPLAEARIRDLRRAESLLGIEGTAWDVANAVLFLVGDDSRYITGQTLVVDGGAGLHRGRREPVRGSA